jgi:phage terminase large subunit-like protein
MRELTFFFGAESAINDAERHERSAHPQQRAARRERVAAQVEAERLAPDLADGSRNEATDGADVSDFAALLLRVSKGFKAGEPLVLTDWQRWLMDALLERNEAGRRRYRRALIGLPRKNGKSLLGSALALYGLFVGERGAEVYSAAGDRQQARIVFGEAKQQVLDSPAFARSRRSTAMPLRSRRRAPSTGYCPLTPSSSRGSTPASSSSTRSTCSRTMIFGMPSL